MTFTSDKQPTHDRSEAGRKGRARSPWNRSTTLFKDDRKRRKDARVRAVRSVSR